MTDFYPGVSSRTLVPGDPATLHDLAARLRSMSGELGDVAGQLRSLTAGDWQGKAANAFHNAVRDEPGRYSTASWSFGSAASAIDAYAGALADAQARAGRAIVVWEEAQAATAAWMHREAASGPHATLNWSHDPGASGRRNAAAMLDQARWEVASASSNLRSALAAAGDAAPRQPGLLRRLVSDVAAIVGGIRRSFMPVPSVPPVAGDEALDIHKDTLKVEGGEGLGAKGQGSYEIARMKSGEYRVTIAMSAGLAARAKARGIGIEGSVSGGDSLVWYVNSKEDAQRLIEQFGVIVLSGTVMPGPLLPDFVRKALNFPAPYSQKQEVDVSAGASAEAGGANVSAEVTAFADLVERQGQTLERQVGIDFDARGELNAGTLGVAASGAVEGDVRATVTSVNGEPTLLTLNGSYTTSGSIKIDGRTFQAGDGNALRVEVSADVDVNKLPPDVRELVLQAADPRTANVAMEELLKHDVHIQYAVYEGSVSTASADIAIASGEMTSESWHLVGSAGS